MEAEVIEVVLSYTGGQEVHTCKSCGFVFAQKRRSDDAIRQDWAQSMFRADGDFDVEQTQSEGYTGYTAKIPAVVARLTYALENFDSEIGFANKTVCDIGAGEGDFLAWVRDRKSPRSVFGVEPSEANGKLLQRERIPHFVGGVEEYAAAGGGGKFDVVTLSWTLENTQSARRVLEIIAGLLPVGGFLQVTTGSRILVPFKKPLHYYFNPRNPVDLHSFHFSHNSLCGLMAATGFVPIRSNRFMDTDYLSVIGQKHDGTSKPTWPRDDYRAVIGFFERWAAETESFYRN
jgi:hypothetical protein